MMMKDKTKKAKDNKPGPKNSELDEIGIDAICERIRNGKTYREIAESVPCSISWLCEWLNKPEHAEKSEMARIMSAEPWLDRGFHALLEAEGKDVAGVQLARAIAQECARRAAIRNPKCSEKHRVEHSGDKESPVTVEIVKYGD